MESTKYYAQLLVSNLLQKGKTISTMESCTGGEIVNSITNIEGCSSIFNFGAVTYSNEYKIKFGVDPKLIEKYTVYSIEVAKEMSVKISQFTGSDYGVGVTGKLNRKDTRNPYGNDSNVYISIYDKLKNNYYIKEVNVTLNNRADNKIYIAQTTINMINDIL